MCRLDYQQILIIAQNLLRSSNLGTLPLWSGIMLGHMGRTRDTNAFVENWFRTTKKVVLRGKLHCQPGQFVQIMGDFVLGRLKGKNVYSVRQAVVSQGEKKKDPTYLPLCQEEPWMKGPLKRKKSKYCNPQKSPQTRSKETLAREGNTWKWECYLDKYMYNRQPIVHSTSNDVKVPWGSGASTSCLWRFMAPVLARGPPTQKRVDPGKDSLAQKLAPIQRQKTVELLWAWKPFSGFSSPHIASWSKKPQHVLNRIVHSQIFQKMKAHWK